MSEARQTRRGSEHQSESNPRKRRRTAIACRTCSARKSRCDGKEPKCSTCIDLAADCIYPSPARESQTQRRSAPSQPQMSDHEFQNRLETMEETMKQFQELLPELRRIVTPNDRRVSEFASESHGIPENVYAPLSPPEDRVDGMGIMLSEDDDDGDEDVGYFGASSNITLLRKITHAFAHCQISHSADPISRRGLGLNQHPSRGRSMSALNPPSLRRPGVSSDIYQLPNLTEGTGLIRQFFSTAGMMLPCFHEPQFVNLLQRALLNGAKTENKTMLAILNLMFAFGKAVATTSSPPYASATEEESNIFYSRAIALMGHAFDPSSLETVQLSLILSTYLMGTQQSVKSWKFHTLAVGGAIKIGLNSRQAGRSLSLLTREMRKRTWLWCVLNDRLLSMLFGRAPLIHPSLVQVDLPVDIAEEFPSRYVSTSVMKLVVDHYSALINLAVLMGEVVEKLYNQNLTWDVETSPEKLVASNLDIVWKLGEWRNALPHALRPISFGEISECSLDYPLDQLRLRIFLTLRYKCVNILANRAILFKYLAHHSGSGVGDRELRLLRTSGQCVMEACREDCIELIEFVSTLLCPATEFESVTLFGAWYFSSYHVFNAALTLLGMLLVSRNPNFRNLFEQGVLTEIRTALDEACKVLNGLHNGNPMILRCAECLPRLIQMYESTGNNRLLASTISGNRNSNPTTFDGALHQRIQNNGRESDFTAFTGLEEADFNIDLGMSSGGLGMNADFDFINNLFDTMPQ